MVEWREEGPSLWRWEANNIKQTAWWLSALILISKTRWEANNIKQTAWWWRSTKLGRRCPFSFTRRDLGGVYNSARRSQRTKEEKDL